MKNGIIDLDVFESLDAIAYQYKIKAGEWAAASGGDINDISRISELRRMLKLKKEGGHPKEVGRAFTVGKCSALLRGLRALIGGEALKKELTRILSKAKTKREKILLMVLALPEDDEDSVDLYLEAVLNKSTK